MCPELVQCAPSSSQCALSSSHCALSLSKGTLRQAQRAATSRSSVRILRENRGNAIWEVGGETGHSKI